MCCICLPNNDYMNCKCHHVRLVCFLMCVTGLHLYCSSDNEISFVCVEIDILSEELVLCFHPHLYNQNCHVDNFFGKHVSISTSCMQYNYSCIFVWLSFLIKY